jgi:hypothetical protein
MTLVAVTVQVYVLAFDNPVTRIGLDAPEAFPAAPPFNDTHETANPEIAAPPSLTGALNATHADPAPPVATTLVGGSGTVAGTNAFDAIEGKLGPTAFVAITVQVYDLPFVSPLTTIGEPAPDAFPVAPPFDDAHVTE